MYWHRFVPVTACFLPQFYGINVENDMGDTVKLKVIVDIRVPGWRSRRAAAVRLGSQVTSLQSDRAASSEKPPHVPHSARCVRFPGKSGIPFRACAASNRTGCF